MRSDRHYCATLNYMHHNPVHHGYVERWTDWPWSSAPKYPAQTDPAEAKRIWHEYPPPDSLNAELRANAKQGIASRKARLRHPGRSCYFLRMSTLAEIESAADALPPEQKQELILFLATRLRKSGVKLPPPRKFSKEQIAAWIAEDEAEMQRFREGKRGCSSTPAYCWPPVVQPPAHRTKSSVKLVSRAGR